MPPSKWLPFILLPPVAVSAAMFVTDFPHVTNLDGPYGDLIRVEIKALQNTAIFTAVVASLVLAATCRPKIAWFMIFVSHLLWVQPIWGFHHVSSLGLFAWIIIAAEEGFSIFPNLLGLPLTVAAHFAMQRLLESGTSGDVASDGHSQPVDQSVAPPPP